MADDKASDDLVLLGHPFGPSPMMPTTRRLVVGRDRLVVGPRWKWMWWVRSRELRRETAEVVRVRGGIVWFDARGKGFLARADAALPAIMAWWGEERIARGLRERGWIVEESVGVRPINPTLVVMVFDRSDRFVVQATTNTPIYGPLGSSVMYEIDVAADAAAITDAIVQALLACNASRRTDLHAAREAEDALHDELDVASRRRLGRLVRQVRISWDGTGWTFEPSAPVAGLMIFDRAGRVSVPTLRDADAVHGALLTALDRCRLRG